MKKIFVFLLVIVLLLPMAVSCTEENQTSATVSTEESKVNTQPQQTKTISVTTSKGTIDFKDEFVNADEIKSKGFYLYTHEFVGVTTPATDYDRVDFTVVENYVVKVWEKGVQSFIPEQNGITVVCVGDDAVKYAQSIEVGYEARVENYELVHLSANYAVVGDIVANIDVQDGIRAPEGVCALYTPDFGKTTGTNVYGAEITVVNGVVTAVEAGKGNADIPKDGYVISVHKDHKSYLKLRNTKVGDKVSLCTEGPSYSVTALEYDGINTVRGENQVVIYRTQATTQTNMYGYEIAVDKNGLSVSESYKGNMNIPQNGMVISAHGNSVKPLSDAYMRGQYVKLDTVNNKVVIINTPELCINQASDVLETALAYFNNAKKAYLNIGYTQISAESENIKSMLQTAEEKINQGNVEEARDICADIIKQAELLRYLSIESRDAQNRAMWYRAYEKSDEEVRATVEKLVSLGVNALYLETFYDGYFIGYSNVEGVEHCTDTGEYDALEGFVRIAHEYGIEVHAWCENFFAGYLNKDGTYSNELLNRFKDKILCDSNGNRFYYYNERATFVFLNPFDVECREFVLNIYRDIIENYDIDGLHLDYIRFPELNYGKYDYGYNEDILTAFAEKTGITEDPKTFAPSSEEQKAWVEFRCGIITSFVGEVFKLVCETDSDIWLSCAVYPDMDYAVNSIFQDVKTWVNKGWIDEVFSMTYSGDNNYVVQNATSYAEICRGKCFYTTGIAAFMDTSSFNFAYQLTDASKAGADGIAIFALSNISPNTYQYEIQLGGFREKSVQLYKCGETVKAQLGFIKEMLGESDMLFDSLSADGKQNLINAIDTVCANIQTPETALEKIEYCRQTVTALNGLKMTVKTAFSDTLQAETVTEEIDMLIRWLEITAQRLDAKR